jgi:hypothetical protein
MRDASMPLRHGGRNGGQAVAFYRVKMTEGIIILIEDERSLETLAADLVRTGHMVTSKPQIASRRLIGKTPLVLMLGNVISLEPSSIDG